MLTILDLASDVSWRMLYYQTKETGQDKHQIGETLVAMQEPHYIEALSTTSQSLPLAVINISQAKFLILDAQSLLMVRSCNLIFFHI